MSLPGHHNQSLKKQNDPQAVLYKIDFIHFFGRTLSFGLIFRFKIPYCTFFFKIQKSRILSNLTVKLTSLPGHLDQSLKKLNDPPAMLYKLDFINFFGRSISFSLIFWFKIHYFSFFFKIEMEFANQNCQKRRFLKSKLCQN